MKKLFLLIFITIFFLPSIAHGKLTFDPTKGIEDTVSFGDTFDTEKMKKAFGEITHIETPGLNSDGVELKSYDFASGFGCLTTNDKVVEMWINSDNIKLNSGIKIKDDVEDIMDKYGKIFLTEGNPRYGEGIMIYNLYPDHLLAFTINVDNQCTNIMSANCALIYKIAPSSSILTMWDAPFILEKPENTFKKMVIINETSSIDGDYLIIKGEVVNNTDQEISYVEIKAKIYDKTGQILDETSSYIEGLNLKPNGTAHFTVISKSGSLSGKYELKLSSQ
jgi:hypothetical protein